MRKAKQAKSENAPDSPVNQVLNYRAAAAYTKGGELNPWNLMTDGQSDAGDPRMKDLEARVSKLGKAMRAFQKRAESAVSKDKTEQITAIFDEFYPEFCKGQVRKLNESQVKSVYQISSEMNVDYKKLIYTLRTLGFPMTKITKGRKANLIDDKNLKLLELLTDQIKTLWRFEDNYKKWIAVLKQTTRLSKSGVAKIMSRKIKHKKVFPGFFDVIPPLPGYVQLLLSKQHTFKFDETLRYDLVTRKGLKKQLQDFIEEALTPILLR